MSKSNKKLLKIHSIKVKQKDIKSSSIKRKFSFVDLSPAEIYTPKKYYTAKFEAHDSVDYLNKNDILIIDSMVKTVKESGIYIFEFDGHILVRQFQIIHFGENKNTYKAVGKTRDNEYYSRDEVNILGAVISKQVELFHNTYYDRHSTNEQYGA